MDNKRTVTGEFLCIKYIMGLYWHTFSSVTSAFLHCGISIFPKVNDLCTSSTAGLQIRCLGGKQSRIISSADGSSANWRCCDIPARHHPSHIGPSGKCCLTDSNLCLTWFQTPAEAGFLSSQTEPQPHSIFKRTNRYGRAMLNGVQSGRVWMWTESVYLFHLMYYKSTLSALFRTLDQHLW